MNKFESRKQAILDLLETITVAFDAGGRGALSVAADTVPECYTEPQALTDCTDEAVWYDEVAPVRHAETAAELDAARDALVRELRGFGWGFLGAGARAALDQLATR